MNDGFENRWWVWLGIVFIIIPLLLGTIMPFVNTGVGDDNGWLGFWGGYLGSIVAVLFAYFNTKYQITREHRAKKEEQKEQILPYFNIDNLVGDPPKLTKAPNLSNDIIGAEFTWRVKLRYETLAQSNIPIENVRVNISVNGFDPRVNIRPRDIGHMERHPDEICFSVKVTKYDLINLGFSESDVVKLFSQKKSNPDRLDLSSKTALGNQVFFTYGNMVNGTAFYKTDAGNWKVYSGEESQLARERLEEYFGDV